MSYLAEFASKLREALPDTLPEDESGEIISFAQNEMLKSYKNGFEAGKKAGLSAARGAAQRPRRRR